MIAYFADREANVLALASSELPEGLIITDDTLDDKLDDGVKSLELYINYGTQHELAMTAAAAGNILLLQRGEGRCFTIVESEDKIVDRQIYVYAEDVGLDLLGEIAEKYEATSDMGIADYANLWLSGNGFEIGTNEITEKKTCKFDSEETVTKRLLTLADEFNSEIDYSFTFNRLGLTHRYVNFYQKRGTASGLVFRIGREVTDFTVKQSAEEIATALTAKGSTSSGSEVTLSGASYDDGDIYLSGTTLHSRTALKKWQKKIPTLGYTQDDITRTFSYDTTDQSVLLTKAVEELKKLSDVQITYEATISGNYPQLHAGDTVRIVDDASDVYVEARVTEIKSHACDSTTEITLGEYAAL